MTFYDLHHGAVHTNHLPTYVLTYLLN